MKLPIPAYARQALDGRLPADVEPVWWSGGDEALAAVAGAEIAWIDVLGAPGMQAIVEAGPDLKWISTTFAGLNRWPLALLKARGVKVTNGSGINAIPVAEFAVLGVLTLAKGLRQLIAWQDQQVFTPHAAGTAELYESKALVLGYGAIGRHIGKVLAGFGCEVTGVRRHPSGEPGVIGPDDWRPRLGEFDWIIVAAPGTDETRHALGADELAAMKRGAGVVNIARGTLIDQAALIAAVTSGHIGGAFVDVTDPEPPSPGDPIWSTPGIVMTGHASGRSQTRQPERAADLFLDNIERWRTGRELRNLVDLDLGY